MLASSWIERYPQTKDLIWFQNLRDLHGLTLEWIAELKAGDLQSYILNCVPPKLAAEARDWLWNLEKWDASPAELHTLINDLSVKDYLLQMESMIKKTQAWCLAGSLASDGDRKITLSRLEQASWRTGRTVGEKRWSSPYHRPDIADLKTVFLTSIDGALHPNSALEPYLFQRLTRDSIRLELLECAHRWPEISTHEFQFASELCVLHSHWTKGFLYSLNPSIQLEHRVADTHCQQLWTKR
jgi:hypothetical protein